MGIDPSPDPVYQGNCFICFGPGLTPRDMYVSFSGIEEGDLWVPADGPPLNGTFLIQQTGPLPCLWRNPAWPNPAVFWSSGLNTSECGMTFPVGVIHFYRLLGAKCLWYFTNSLIAPAGNHFYGGQAQVFVHSGSVPPSISEVYDQLNIEKLWEAPFEVFPINGQEMNVRIARKKDGTNIMIRVDTSEI